MCIQCVYLNCRGILVLNIGCKLNKGIGFLIKKKKLGWVKGEGELVNGKEKIVILNNLFSINFMKEFCNQNLVFYFQSFYFSI